MMDNNQTMWHTEITHEGMSLRDYFAAKAMPMLMQEWSINIFDNDTQDEVAKNCYAMADAMLKAREQ